MQEKSKISEKEEIIKDKNKIMSLKTENSRTNTSKPASMGMGKEIMYISQEKKEWVQNTQIKFAKNPLVKPCELGTYVGAAIS